MQPTNYTISYYQGDDFSLVVYPKDSTGAAIPIEPTDTPFFKIASSRGPGPTSTVIATASIASISGGPNAIIATVTSGAGTSIKNGYVYDIGYVKAGKRVTILTGSFSVVERVYPIP